MSDRVALITGVTGQDGSLLARLLLEKGYVVHGIKRRSSSFNTERIDDLYVDPHEGETRFLTSPSLRSSPRGRGGMQNFKSFRVLDRIQ